MKNLLSLIATSFIVIACSQDKYKLSMLASEAKDIVSDQAEISEVEEFEKYLDIINSDGLSENLEDFFNDHKTKLGNKYLWSKDSHQDYYSFLQYATMVANKDVVVHLIENLKCDPNDTTGSLQRTLLHLAAINGSLDLTKYLIETTGLDPNIRDFNQSLALHHAVAGMKTELVKYFLENENLNIDIGARDNDGFTILHLATMTGETYLVKLCITHLQKRFDEDRFREIVNLYTESGNTALHLAASQCNGMTIDFLLTAGADKKARTKKLNRYPYQIAEKRRKTIVAEKLKFDDKY